MHRLILLLLLVPCLLSRLSAQSEVTVTPMVPPPYSPYLYDYEDELILTLQNNTNRELRLKLSGRLENDLGMAAFTEPGFQPVQAIELAPLEVKVIIAGAESEGFLDRDNLEIIAPEEVERNILRTGILPEGNYQFCVQALDYETNAPLSMSAPAGCLFFPLSRLQPPVLINPACETTLVDEWPVFTWTPPIGNAAGADFRYDLYLLRLFPGQNANDAMNRAVEYRAGNPIIFEDLFATTYAYQPSDQPLDPGATYAVQVVARDADGRLAFVNGGRGVVCTITLPEEGRQDGEDEPTTVSGGGTMTLVGPTEGGLNLPYGLISGRLLYQFPYPKPARLGSAEEPSGPVFQATTDQLFVADMAQEIQEQARQQNQAYQAGLVDQNLAEQLVGIGPDYSQPFWFGPQVAPNDPQPLANTRINLLVRYVMQGATIDGEYFTYKLLPPGAIQGQTTFLDNALYENGQVLASTYTDEDGNYELNFPLLDSLIVIHENGAQLTILDSDVSPTGNVNVATSVTSFQKLYRVVRLEVDNPYFASPEVNIALQPNQGLFMPDVIALVKAYNLKVNVRSNEEEGQVFGKNAPLGGIQVDIRRENAAQYLPFFLPPDEGHDLDLSELDIGGYKDIIGRRITNKDGQAFFSHLVRHHPTTLNDRFDNKAYSQSSNTELAYHPQYFDYPDAYEFPFINPPPPDAPYPFIKDQYANGGGAVLPVYNSEVTVETYETTVVMRPNDPRVSGRVRHDTEPLKGAFVSLYQEGKSAYVAFTTTDAEGYFRFEDLQPDHGYYLKIWHPGYEMLHHPQLPDGAKETFSLAMGEMKAFKEIQLQPLGQVKGYVANEAGNPLQADVKIGVGPWIETQWMGPPTLLTGAAGLGADAAQTFSLQSIFPGQQSSGFIAPAQSGLQIPIIIDPFSDQYFRDTFYVDIPANAGLRDLGVFVLKERLHRARIRVTNEAGQTLVGAQVQLEEMSRSTNRVGHADFVFANAGQYFFVRVDPPAGTDLAPFQDYVQVPVSKDWYVVDIVLRPGVTVSGIVTAGPDSLPLADARVFIEDNTSLGQGLPLVETYTGADGAFTLSGIPRDTLLVHGMMQGTVVSFYLNAVKTDPNVAYVGDKNLVAIPPTGPMHLHLDIIQGVDGSRLLGFPVEIEEYQEGPNGQAVISGAFVDLPANPNFALRMANFRLPFEDIPVEPGASTNAQGTPYWEPLLSRVPVELDAVPLNIYSGFQGELRPSPTVISGGNQPNALGFKDIAVERVSPGQGVLRGGVFLELESFKFSYNYTGDFYLGDTPDDGVVPVFRPEGTPYPERGFHVGDHLPILEGLLDMSFSVHEFPAHADRTKSFIQGDTVRLSTVLHTNISLSDPPDLAIEAGEIKITPQAILPFSQGKQLAFELEAWQVVSVTGWFYDPVNGGLHVPQAVIKTGYVDVPVQSLVIRYDDLNQPTLDLNNPNQPFRLAGVADLTLTGYGAQLHYDQATITDLKPHWIIEILGSATKPAATATLPNIQQPVKFTNFKLISNGTMDVNVPVQSLRVYDIMDVVTTGLTTGPDFFRIQGSGDLSIPGLNGDLSTILEFTRSGGQVQTAVKPLTMEIAGAGKVFFSSHTGQSDQQFSTGAFTSYGHFTVEDQNGNFFTLQSKLTKTNGQCHIDIIQVNNQNQKIVCGGSGGNALEVFGGSMVANLATFQWAELEFDARPLSTKGLAADTKIMHFTVYGDIEASDEEIKVSGFDIGFAEMELTFNISDMTLTGELLIGGSGMPPLTIGVATINSGQFNFLMSDRGFYFLFGGEVNVPVVGDIGACVLVGHYDQVDPVMEETLAAYAYQNAFPAAFQNGFSGFLVNGYWEPVDASSGETILNMTVEAYVNLGVEVRLAADFTDGYYLFSCLGYGGIGLSFSFDLLVCDVGFGAHIALELLAKTEIQDSNFKFTGCASLALGLVFDACLDTICWENALKMVFTMDTGSGVDFETFLGETCSGNSLPLGLDKGAGGDDDCD